MQVLFSEDYSTSINPPTPKQETPLQALTNVVAGLEKGGQAEITANAISIPGPISEAQGQPLVFQDGNNAYFAFTQDNAANFDQKRPPDVASDMAIVKEPSSDANISTESAHLNKTGQLVDANGTAVGYSTGGDNTGK